jgi:hypothetical protein
MSGTMTLETHAARVWHCRLRTFVTVFFFSVEKSMYFIHMLPASFLYIYILICIKLICIKTMSVINL